MEYVSKKYEIDKKSNLQDYWFLKTEISLIDRMAFSCYMGNLLCNVTLYKIQKGLARILAQLYSLDQQNITYRYVKGTLLSLLNSHFYQTYCSEIFQNVHIKHTVHLKIEV